MMQSDTLPPGDACLKLVASHIHEICSERGIFWFLARDTWLSGIEALCNLLIFKNVARDVLIASVLFRHFYP